MDRQRRDRIRQPGAVQLVAEAGQQVRGIPRVALLPCAQGEPDDGRGPQVGEGRWDETSGPVEVGGGVVRCGGGQRLTAQHDLRRRPVGWGLVRVGGALHIPAPRLPFLQQVDLDGQCVARVAAGGELRDVDGQAIGEEGEGVVGRDAVTVFDG